MNLKTELIFRPTKVEDELPKKEGYYFSNDEEREDIHWFGNWFGSGVIRHFLLKTWLKPTKAFVFTSEELKQLLQDYTDKIVENVGMSVQPSEMEAWEVVPTEITRKDVDDEESGCEDFWITVDKKSITNQLGSFLKNLL